jgi:hypothetical protein
MNVYFCAEDALSKTVGLRLLSVHPQAHLTELAPLQGGNALMRARFGEYCRLATHYPTLILTDLDAVPCAPELRGEWVKAGKLREPLPQWMALCIAVREVEAWLLADSDRFADFLGVRRSNVAAFPEDVADPKSHIVQLARTSRKKMVRQGVPPPRGSSAKVGLDYNAFLGQFARADWRPDLASANSPSLRRALDRVAALGA